MKSKTLTCITAMTLFAALAAPVQMGAQDIRYKLIDIPTLGGPAAAGNVDSVPTGASSRSAAITASPTTPPAPLRGQPRSAMWARRTAISTLTTIAGTLGAPQLSLPLGAVDGFPVGLSLLAAPGGDEMLLRFAREL